MLHCPRVIRRGYGQSGALGFRRIVDSQAPSRVRPYFLPSPLARKRSRVGVLAARLRPSFATTTGRRGGRPAKRGKRSAERRIVQPCPRQARRRTISTCLSPTREEPVGAPAFRRSRLRHSPPASTPMAQLQNRVSRDCGRRVFCPPCRKLPRLSTLRADRSLCRSTGDPEPPGCGLAIPRAGTASRFRLCGLPFRKGALKQRDLCRVSHLVTLVNERVTS